MLVRTVSRSASRSRTSNWRRRARNATWTVLTRTMLRRGRSSRVTFPLGPKSFRISTLAASSWRPGLSRIRMGRSDHLDCLCKCSMNCGSSAAESASSARRTAPASPPISSQSSSSVWHTLLVTLPRLRASAASAASRPVGVRIRTGGSLCSDTFIAATSGARGPVWLRRSAENTAEFCQRPADIDFPVIHCHLANAPFVLAGSLFDHGNRLVDGTAGFVVAQGNDAIRQVGHVERRPHLAEHPVGRQHHDGDDALLVEIGHQLVQLEVEKTLVAHGVEEAVQAVDLHNIDSVTLDG